MSWEVSIAECETREEARQKFHEWCEMREEVHDQVEFAGRQNDVARLHIETDGTHLARDITQRYNSTSPLRVIGVNAVDEERVEVVVLLAELEVREPYSRKD